MTPAFAISLYLVIWWVILFAILPIGVRTQSDDGEIVPGTAESAPHNPNLLPKIVGTTVVASIIFAVLYVIIVHKVFTLDDIPFLPRYENVQ
jgi:predicted secreted protein